LRLEGEVPKRNVGEPDQHEAQGRARGEKRSPTLKGKPIEGGGKEVFDRAGEGKKSLRVQNLARTKLLGNGLGSGAETGKGKGLDSRLWQKRPRQDGEQSGFKEGECWSLVKALVDTSWLERREGTRHASVKTVNKKGGGSPRENEF